MTYKIRLRHKIPNKVFHLTLRYDDPSLNIPEIGIDLSDSFQIFELTGWHIIPGFIDVSKIKLVGSLTEGNTLYIANNLNIISVVETVDEDVNIDGAVRFEKDNVDVTIEGTVRNEIDVTIDGKVREEIDVDIDGIVKEEPVSLIYSKISSKQ